LAGHRYGLFLSRSTTLGTTMLLKASAAVSGTGFAKLGARDRRLGVRGA
jgi:hypothetical protein